MWRVALAGLLSCAWVTGCSSNDAGSNGGTQDSVGAGHDASASNEAGGSHGDASSADGSSPDGSAADGGAGDARAAALDAGAGSDAQVVAAGVRWIGRVDVSDPSAPAFAWSGSGFIANVSGPTIAVTLETRDPSDAGMPVFFQPVIDGIAGTRFSIAGATQTVMLGTGLAQGNHVVELYRETEGKFGTSVFHGFASGTLAAPPAFSGRLIEVVGDSISAGYGDLGSEQHPGYGPDPDGGCLFSTQTESAYDAYGAVAAHALGADSSLIAMSGWGMVRDNTGNTSNVLPSVYPDTLGPNAAPAWAFTPEPQAVVINLGTNDFANNSDPGATAFEGAYTAFLATVRGHYPDAWIFCSVGPLLSGTGLTAATTYVKAVVASAQAAGDSKVQYLSFGTQDITQGTGCQYHPNATEQQTMANALVAAIHSALGW